MNVIASRHFSVPGFLKNNYYTVVFFIYLVLLAITVSRHEPWMDEAQAWLLVKDLGVKELFLKYLRYEGSPGLWHLILLIPARLGLPYITINIISAVISAAGVWLFLKYAPFPRLIKILYPFSFFIFFQYGVVARSYCLIAPVLFLTAMSYDRKKDHPYVFTGLLCLLANISLHTFIVAGCIAFIHFTELVTDWKMMDTRQKIHQFIAMSLLGLVACLVIVIVMTPPDQTFAGYANWELDNFINISEGMIGGSLVTAEFNHFPLLYGTASFIIFIITLQWFAHNKLGALYLLPLFLLSALFAIKYRSPWHQGVLFLLWLFVLWISFKRLTNTGTSALQKAMLGSLGIVLAIQVYWSTHSIVYDLRYNYSGSYNLARFIKKNNLQKGKIYVSGWRTISVLPYFSGNIFYNHNYGSGHRFWNWSTNNITSVGAGLNVLDTIECEQPDLVIFSSDHIPSQKKIVLPGYKAVAFFPGYLYWKTGAIEPECYLVFKKNKRGAGKIAYQNKQPGFKLKNVR